VPDPAPSTEKLLSREAARARFEQALRSLPEHLREALILTQWDGLSQKQAAELLGVKIKTVENRIYAAKQRLAHLVAPSDLEDLAERT